MEFRIDNEWVRNPDHQAVLRYLYAVQMRHAAAHGYVAVALSREEVLQRLDTVDAHGVRNGRFDTADFTILFGSRGPRPESHPLFRKAQSLFNSLQSTNVAISPVHVTRPAPSPPLPSNPGARRDVLASRGSSLEITSPRPSTLARFARPFVLRGTNIEFAEVWRYNARRASDATSQLSVRWGFSNFSRLSMRFTLADAIDEILRGLRGIESTAIHVEIAGGSRLLGATLSLGVDTARKWIVNLGLRMQVSALATIRPRLYRGVRGEPWTALGELKENEPIFGGIRTKAQQLRAVDLDEIRRLTQVEGAESAIRYLRNLYPYISEERARRLIVSPSRGVGGFVFELVALLGFGRLLDQVLPDGHLKNGLEASFAFLPAQFVRGGITRLGLSQVLASSFEGIPFTLVHGAVSTVLDKAEELLGVHIPYREELIDPLLSLALYYRIKISLLKWIHDNLPGPPPGSAPEPITVFPPRHSLPTPSRLSPIRNRWVSAGLAAVGAASGILSEVPGVLHDYGFYAEDYNLETYRHFFSHPSNTWWSEGTAGQRFVGTLLYAGVVAGVAAGTYLAAKAAVGVLAVETLSVGAQLLARGAQALTPVLGVLRVIEP